VRDWRFVMDRAGQKSASTHWCPAVASAAQAGHEANP